MCKKAALVKRNFEQLQTIKYKAQPSSLRKVARRSRDGRSQEKLRLPSEGKIKNIYI